jgi:DNA invertase Pin-like site-specific DNA recombinase
LSVVKEQCSGSIAFIKRDRGGEVFRTLKHGDVLIAAKLDRVWRSAKDALVTIDDFKKRGIAVHLLDIPGGSITGNGVSELLFTLLSAVGQWERSRISERTREAKREAARRGYYIGGKQPWEKTILRGKLVDDPKKVIVVRRIRKWRSEGIPLRRIVERVAEHGFRISTDAIRRLTENVPNAVRTRGRRRRTTDVPFNHRTVNGVNRDPRRTTGSCR